MKAKAQRPSSDKYDNLPQNIIETILCLVPIKDAVRTSILSRSWRYNWVTIPKLVFSEKDIFDRTTFENEKEGWSRRLSLEKEDFSKKFTLERKELTRKLMLEKDEWSRKLTLEMDEWSGKLKLEKRKLIRKLRLEMHEWARKLTLEREELAMKLRLEGDKIIRKFTLEREELFGKFKCKMFSAIHQVLCAQGSNPRVQPFTEQFKFHMF